MTPEQLQEENERLKKALLHVVAWWDEWNNSSAPADVPDLPIEDFRKLL